MTQEPNDFQVAMAAAQRVAGESPGLHAKLAQILETMPDVRPEGNNSHFKYRYWETNQITGLFRQRFGRAGISFMADVIDYQILPHSTAKGGASFLTTMRVLFSLTDAQTGEQVSGHGLGQGDDPGDKGANKAFAAALKYWLIKTFLLGGVDSESDDATDEREMPPARSRSRDSGRGQDVSISDSNIEGIQRGGRSNKATSAQVTKVRRLARDAKLGAEGTIEVIQDRLGIKIEVPEGEDPGPVLVGYLESIGAEEIGTLITYMDQMIEEEAGDAVVSDAPY